MTDIVTERKFAAPAPEGDNCPHPRREKKRSELLKSQTAAVSQIRKECGRFESVQNNLVLLGVREYDVSQRLQCLEGEKIASLMGQQVRPMHAIAAVLPEWWSNLSDISRVEFGGHLRAILAPRANFLRQQYAQGAIPSLLERQTMLGELARDAFGGAEYLQRVADGESLGKLGPGVETVERSEGGEGERTFSRVKIKLRDPLPYIQELNRIDGVGKDNDGSDVKVLLMQILSVTSPSATGFSRQLDNPPGERVTLAQIRELPARGQTQVAEVSPESVPSPGGDLPPSDHKGGASQAVPGASCEAVSVQKGSISTISGVSAVPEGVQSLESAAPGPSQPVNLPPYMPLLPPVVNAAPLSRRRGRPRKLPVGVPAQPAVNPASVNVQSAVCGQPPAGGKPC